jgi:phospholipase/lecithinase/hemolysin
MTTAPAYDRLVYFGDSLTDGGAYFDLTSRTLTDPLPTGTFGYAGLFSNGDIYADIAPELLGMDAADVVNYAVGGARVLGERTLADKIAGDGVEPLLVADPAAEDLAFGLNLWAQVERFLADAAVNGVPENTAASLWIGLNDFNNFVPSNPEMAEAEASALVQQLVTSTLGAAGALAQAGVSTIILNTIPPGSFFPIFQFADPLVQALGDQVIAGYNGALIEASAQLEGLGVTVEIVDMHRIASEVMADPETFGFLTVADQKYFGTGADPFLIDMPGGPVPFFLENPAVADLDADQFAFYDLLHPTTALHGVLGAFTEASLTNDVHFLDSEGNRLKADSGDDLVLAGAGNDRVELGSGNDVVLAGLGNDRASGGRGSDILSGGSGDDRLSGGRGSDVIAGGTGNDDMYGGKGSDALIDGLGSDRVYGGSGDDFFFFTEAELIGGATDTDSDLFFGGSGHDTLYLALSDGTRAIVEAVFGGGGSLTYEFDAINLTTVGIEEVIFLDSRGLPDELDADATLATLLAEADYWGFA